MKSQIRNLKFAVTRAGRRKIKSRLKNRTITRLVKPAREKIVSVVPMDGDINMADLKKLGQLEMILRCKLHTLQEKAIKTQEEWKEQRELPDKIRELKDFIAQERELNEIAAMGVEIIDLTPQKPLV